MMKKYIIQQGKLTPECWAIQIEGLNACKHCEFLNTPECGGKRIRKTLLNKKGHKVPIAKKDIHK